MDQFEYVMVLVSIIIGLGITHILLGISELVDRLSGRGDRLELSVAHAFWLAFWFEWLIMFWWAEYRFASRVSEWTIGLYVFLIAYAVSLFLLAVVLVPRSWEGVTSLKDYFLRRRLGFYSLLLLAIVLDTIDSYLKGGVEYLLDTGPINLIFSITVIPIVIVGIKSENIRFHNFAGILCFSCETFILFDVYDLLAQ